MFTNAPAFAAAVVLTLSLGIGANSAIFSVFRAVLLEPLPYRNADRLVMLSERRAPSALLDPVAPANFADWRSQNTSFDEVAAINPSPAFVLTGQGEPARLTAAAATSNLFALLGVPIALGRDFQQDDDRPGRNRVVILSHGTWTRRFGANPAIVGSPVALNDQPYTVVGVLPREFEFVSKPSDFQGRSQFDVWVPLALDPAALRRNTHELRVLARLRTGVTASQAQTDMDVIGANLARLHPQWNKDVGVVVMPLLDQVTSDVRGALGALAGAVGLVLLITCANVANLLVNRAASRAREIALRLALGASRFRLGQQLLTESLVLAAAGGVGGAALAFVSVRALVPVLPLDLPRVASITVDVPVLLFTGAISIVTGVLFGLAPLVAARRVNAHHSLKQGTRVVSAQSRLRNVLVVSQLVVAVVLLVGAGLMAKSFWTLLNVPPGFRTDHVLTARVSLSAARYPDANRIGAFQDALLERVRQTPGVQSAGLTAYLPFSGTDNGWGFEVEGRPPLPQGVFNMAKYRPVSAGYFDAIGIPLRQGRDFSPTDTREAAFVAIVNDAMARQYWGNENPVGQRIRFGPAVWRTIVGVVGNVHHEGLDTESAAEMYVPFVQSPNNEARTTLVVRASGEPAALSAALHGAVTAVDPNVPVDLVTTIEQLVSASLGHPRLRTTLFAAFSLLALLIAAVGTYGVMSYLVTERTREFGVRLAVGATQRDLLTLVLMRSLTLIAPGLGIGVAASLALGQMISSLLYGITPRDPLTFAIVTTALAGVALLASYLPARRASRLDPMLALRYD